MQMLEKVIFDIIGAYFIIEDTDGNIIYPTDKDKLIETRKIMSCQEGDKNLVNYNNEIYGYHVTNFEYDGKSYIIKSLNNITKHKNTEQKLLTDDVSGLKNNKGTFQDFDNFLVDVVGRDKEFSCVYLDLDNFKEVNDTYGHDAGNLVLKKVGDIIKQCIRETDIAGRIGGDEFLIILKEIGPNQSIYKTKEIATKLNDMKIVCEGKTIDSVGSSIGLYHVNARLLDESSTSIIEIRKKIKKAADNCMYSIKKQDKNAIAFGCNYNDDKKLVIR